VTAKTCDHLYRYEGRRAPCRIRVYQAAGQTDCLATERQGAEGGTAITDAAARIATQVERWHRPAHDGQFLWVEHWQLPRGPGPRGEWETFAFVAFQRGAGGGFCCPEWRSTGREAVEALIGAAVEA